MNGLLNYQPDPIAQSLLGFAGGLLTPVSRGGGFGAGLLGASQGMSQARQEAMQIEQMKRQMAQDELRKRLIEAQVKETENQAAERMLKVEQDRRLQGARSNFLERYTSPDFPRRDVNPGQPEGSQIGGARTSRFANPQFIAEGLAAGFKLDDLKAMAEAQDLGRPQIASWQEVRLPDGSPGAQAYSKTGDPIGQPVAKATALHWINNGQRTLGVNNYTGQQVTPGVQMQMTPGEVSRDQIAKAQLDVSRGNLGVAQGNLELAKRRAADDAMQPQYMTVAGPDGTPQIVALPKKVAAGQAPIGTPVMGADGNVLRGPEKPLPNAVAADMVTMAESANVIDRALNRLKTPEGQGAVGWKNFAYVGPGRKVIDRNDPEGVLTRADLADITSLKVKDRSGATVTAAEEPRLIPWLPQLTDSAQEATRKLERMKQIIEENAMSVDVLHPGAGKKFQDMRSRADTSAKPAGKGLPKVATDADFDALPSGSMFVGPDGKTRKKP